MRNIGYNTLLLLFLLLSLTQLVLSNKTVVEAKEVTYSFPSNLSNTLGFKSELSLTSKNVQKITHIHASVFCFQIAELQKSRFVFLNCPINQRVSLSNQEGNGNNENDEIRCRLVYAFPEDTTRMDSIEDIKPLSSVQHEGVDCSLLRISYSQDSKKRSKVVTLFCKTAANPKFYSFQNILKSKKYKNSDKEIILDTILKFGDQIQILKIAPSQNKSLQFSDINSLQGLLVKIPTVSLLKNTKLRKMKDLLNRAPDAILKPFWNWNKLTLIQKSLTGTSFSIHYGKEAGSTQIIVRNEIVKSNNVKDKIFFDEISISLNKKSTKIQFEWKQNSILTQKTLSKGTLEEEEEREKKNFRIHRGESEEENEIEISQECKSEKTEKSIRLDLSSQKEFNQKYRYLAEFKKKKEGYSTLGLITCTLNGDETMYIKKQEEKAKLNHGFKDPEAAVLLATYLGHDNTKVSFFIYDKELEKGKGIGLYRYFFKEKFLIQEF